MELICQVRSTSERKQLEAISAHGYISYLVSIWLTSAFSYPDVSGYLYVYCS